MTTYPIDTYSGSANGVSYTLCPNGPDPTAVPPQCIVEVDLGNASLTLTPADGGAGYDLGGTVPVRLQDLPIEGTAFMAFTATGSLTGSGTCPGGTYALLTVSGSIQAGGGPVQVGCSALSVTALQVEAVQIQNDSALCASTINPSLVSTVKQAYDQALTTEIQSALDSAFQSQACLQ